jgi:hypothetical protein
MKSLMNEREAAAFLSLQPATLRHWRVQGRGPGFYRIGGAIRYRMGDLESFLTAGHNNGEGLGS